MIFLFKFNYRIETWRWENNTMIYEQIDDLPGVSAFSAIVPLSNYNRKFFMRQLDQKGSTKTSLSSVHNGN